MDSGVANASVSHLRRVRLSGVNWSVDVAGVRIVPTGVYACNRGGFWAGNSIRSWTSHLDQGDRQIADEKRTEDDQNHPRNLPLFGLASSLAFSALLRRSCVRGQLHFAFVHNAEDSGVADDDGQARHEEGGHEEEVFRGFSIYLGKRGKTNRKVHIVRDRCRSKVPTQSSRLYHWFQVGSPTSSLTRNSKNPRG